VRNDVPAGGASNAVGAEMGFSTDSRARFNLAQVSVLLLEETSLGMSILVQILNGFGARKIHRCDTVEKAEKVVQETDLDLLIIDAMGRSGAGYDFVRWLRRSGLRPNCYVPVILTAAHTPASAIARARDCGAHILMAKPLTPRAMLDRIVWVARAGRRFVECDSYAGPDRRFKVSDLPAGVSVGRRRQDGVSVPG
jgi:DNA-binding response OmpR family regulator